MIRFQKIDFDVTQYFGDLKKYFAGRQDIDLVYIFGSYSTGYVTALSDVDIAYLSKGQFDFHSEMSLELDIINILHTEEVDCVNLSKAPIVIRYKIVSNGKILLCRSELVREFFESKTFLDYFDLQPIRERYFQKMQEKIMRGD